MVQWPLNIIPRKVDNAMNVILQKILDIETNQIKIDVHRKLIRGNIEHKVFRTIRHFFIHRDFYSTPTKDSNCLMHNIQC